MREQKSVLKFYLHKSDLKHTPPLNVSLIDPCTLSLCNSGLSYLTPLSTIFQLYRGRSVLLVEETGIPGENHRPVASH